MASPTAAELFDDFAARYARGERPDARAYLLRARGREADELARLIDGFLRAAPPPPASPDSVAAVRARLAHEPPLLEARRRRRLRRADVVERLLAELGLAPEKRAALGLRYHELESGRLDPAAVSERVWAALSELLGLDALRLASSWRPARAEPGVAFLRASAPSASAEAVLGSKRGEYDEEVDSLFLSAR